MAVPSGASTETVRSLRLASLGKTSVKTLRSPVSKASNSARLFMVITSAGISSGATISARANSSLSPFHEARARPDGSPAKASRGRVRRGQQRS